MRATILRSDRRRRIDAVIDYFGESAEGSRSGRDPVEAFASPNDMPSWRYIDAAVARCPRAGSRLPIRE